MSRCEEYRELISCLLDEPLNDREKAALTEHIEQCDACAAFYKAMTAVSAFIAEDLEEPPEELRENIMASIRREEVKKKNRLSPMLRTVLTAAACLAVLAAVSYGLSPGQQKQLAASVLEGSRITAEESRAMAPAEAPMAAAAEGTEVEENCSDSAVFSADAAPEESAQESDKDIAALDLTGKMSVLSLHEALGGTPVDLDREELKESLVARLTVDGDSGPCTLLLFLRGETLYYYDPVEDAVFLADCGAEMLDFLTE